MGQLPLTCPVCIDSKMQPRQHARRGCFSSSVDGSRGRYNATSHDLRTGGGAVERAGLENQYGLRVIVGSNPTLSACCQWNRFLVGAAVIIRKIKCLDQSQRVNPSLSSHHLHWLHLRACFLQQHCYSKISQQLPKIQCGQIICLVRARNF